MTDAQLLDDARKFWKTFPHCVGYPVCDGDLMGEPHDPECPMFEHKQELTYMEFAAKFAASCLAEKGKRFVGQKQLITGEHGDCLRAAFANCLGIAVELLPHYEDANWFEQWCAWFRERGLGLVWYGFTPELRYGFPGTYVLSVKSARLEGKMHCVVAKDGEVLFDPHPEADETPCDPETADGAFLFHVLDVSGLAGKDEEIERLKAGLEATRKQIPHPGDGSCDHCGKVPSIHIPTALCDECRDGVSRAESAERELAELKAENQRREG